jgi:AraC family transcriptional regulator
MKGLNPRKKIGRLLQVRHKSLVTGTALSSLEARVNERRRMLIDLETGASRPVVTQAPTLTSSSSPWDGILLEQLGATGPLELVNMASPQVAVIVQMTDKTCEWSDAAGSRQLQFAQGQIHVLPAMYPFTMRSRQSGNLVSISVESRFLRCAAHDLCRGPDRMEITHQAPLEDALIREITLALRAEAERGCPGGKLYGECLAAALAVHLVRHYSTVTPNRQASGRGPLREQIRRAVYYIHEHFAADISLASLATEAGLSPFHFARLFRDSTGLAPHQYVVQCRVERARELLLSGAQSTAEIAVAVGFCDQSHLTTHFKRVFGLTPKKFRQQATSRRT